MPTERLTMRKIREVLRLRFDFKLSYNKIAQSCQMGRSTVGDYIQRFDKSQLSWPLPDGIDDAQLERLLFLKPQTDSSCTRPRRPPADWAYIHKELRRKAVTLMLLWQEYKEQHPDGLQYSQFCQRYRNWAQRIEPVMRIEHRAGQSMFVDYAGMTVPVFDPDTGSVRQAQIFVAALGASSYSYAEASWTQSLPDWIGSQVRSFEFFGGVTESVVPDNLKTGVTKANYYEPDINPTYLDFARHYGTVIIPTRVNAPRDKAKVESAVQVVERWILARLRNRKFFGLHQLNSAIAQLLVELNNKAFQKLPGSRRSMYESLDRPALKPLPARRYEFAEWKKATVNIDYHIEVQRHYYSVPHQLIKKKLDVRITENSIECFYRNKQVATHRRSRRKGGYTTLKEHMPKSHQKWAEWNPDRFIRWAAKIGPDTAKLIETVIGSRPVPQQGYRSCLGILRLAERFGDQRLEAASKRALAIGAKSYKSIESILKHNLDAQRMLPHKESAIAIEHGNIRGAQYYQ
jgi:transposase